jgi:hypothetical protein
VALPAILGENEISREEKVNAADPMVIDQPSKPKRKCRPPKGKRQLPKRGTDYNFRLVGPDKLLVKACSYRATKREQPVTIWPIVVPESMIPAILGLFHGDKSPLLHLGKHKTYGVMRKRFVWKGMVQSIRQWIGACHKCLRRKRTPPEHHSYHVHPKAVAAMNRICVDIVGPFEQSKQGNTHIMTIYDPFSHWPSAYPIKKQDAATVIECLRKHIALHSAPAELLSDRGKNFLAKPVKDFLEEMGTKKYETTPYKPSSNGSVERFHRYLSAALHHVTDKHPENWEDHLDTVLFAYRTSPIDGLNITPFEVVYGRRPNLPIDNILFRENYDKSVDNLQQYMEFLFDNQENMFEAVYQERQDRFDRNKRAAGRRKPIPVYNVGEKVYLSFPKGHFCPPGGSTKLAPRNDGPYKVLERLHDGLVYKVQHDTTGYIHNTSVARMIPITDMVIPSNATDLPLPNVWKQMTERSDRMNDMSEEKYLERQREMKANDEAKAMADDESKRDMSEPNEKAAMHVVEMNKSKKRAMQDTQQSITKKTKTNPAVPIDAAQTGIPQPDSQPQSAAQEAKMPKKKTQSTQPVQTNYRKEYSTDATSRAQRMAQRAAARTVHTEPEPESSILWLALAPYSNKSTPTSRRRQRIEQHKRRVLESKAGAAAGVHDRVTPGEGEENRVRLGVRSVSKRWVEGARCTPQQWLGQAGQQPLSDLSMKRAEANRSTLGDSLQTTPSH